MEPLTNTMNNYDSQTQESILVDEEEVQELRNSLPKATFMGSNLQLVKFKGFWCPASLNLKNVLVFQRHFHAQDTDIIIASLPKTENGIYGEAFTYPRAHHIDELPFPRLLHTHLPYASLPGSIKISKCRI
ncbi:Cytosolic sulfotransferase 13 [Bienertia sinuspersici]